MKFKLEVKMDNAAFQGDEPELSDILRRLSAQPDIIWHRPNVSGMVKDTNGNRVGSWSIGS